MAVDNLKAPYSSTGSMDTMDIPLRALVDWVSITFFDLQNWEKVTQILSLDSDEFIVQNKGFNGYMNSATYGSILIAFNDDGRNEMGIHLCMSGQACREYEKLFDLDLDWQSFFALVTNFPINVSRLDIAIDDFKGYFTIDQVYKNAKRGCMTATRVTKARRFEEFFIDNGETCGQTFYVGKTNWVIRFYDKLAERKNKGKDVLLDFWNRYEIQLRSNVANEAIKYLAFNQTELGQFVKGFLMSKIDFKINNKTDTNKSRWKSQKWWLDFLQDVESIPLTQKAPDMTIEKKYKWIDKQVARSFYMLTKAFPDEKKLVQYLKYRGLERIDKSHEREIDDFKNSPESFILNREMNEFINNTKKDFLGPHL